MAFCTTCGKELTDEARFCSHCGASTGTAFSSGAEGNASQKYGTCPYCGEILKSFAPTCPSCGHELRMQQVLASVQSFSERYEAASSTEKRVSLLRSFPIPNSKEGIVEFLIMAASNLEAGFDEEESEGLERAWYSKASQAIEKASLVIPDDETYLRIRNRLEKKMKSWKKGWRKNSRRKSLERFDGETIQYLVNAALILILLLLLMLMPFLY